MISHIIVGVVVGDRGVWSVGHGRRGSGVGRQAPSIWMKLGWGGVRFLGVLIYDLSYDWGEFDTLLLRGSGGTLVFLMGKGILQKSDFSPPIPAYYDPLFYE